MEKTKKNNRNIMHKGKGDSKINFQKKIRVKAIFKKPEITWGVGEKAKTKGTKMFVKIRR